MLMYYIYNEFYLLDEKLIDTGGNVLIGEFNSSSKLRKTSRRPPWLKGND